MEGPRSMEKEPTFDADLASVFFRPVRWQSAYEETVERLAQAIKLGAVEVGAQLPSERELVVKLQVSRTTLREAIRALQQGGVLKTRRGRSGGTFVAADGVEPMSKSQAKRFVEELGGSLLDLIDLRAAVEPKAAELAAARGAPGAVVRLQALLDRSHEAPVSGLRRSDSLLHIAIARMAASDLLMDSVLKVQTRLHDLLAFLTVVPTPKVAARHESRQHESIVDAIAARDARGAREAMATHTAATEELLSEVLNVSTASLERSTAGRGATGATGTS
jgi:GntR family L-lactate dehydrogenase operon transcriptional regulator